MGGRNTASILSLALFSIRTVHVREKSSCLLPVDILVDE